ncbi:MAG TPA: tetratricopeptide repeat protein, partial [Flavobacteriales bacterium]|nr:tetratricopeptide repeat protein [Flavobacteriales bacterium]
MKIKLFIQSASFFLSGLFSMVLLCCNSHSAFGQEDKYLDSLKKALELNMDVKKQLSTYSEITQYLLSSNPAEARSWALKGLKLARRYNRKQAEANLRNDLGNSYYYEGNFADALDYYTQCLTLNKKLGSRKDEARCYSNIGLVYLGTGNYTKAQDYFIQSLKIREELNDQPGKAYVLSNLASLQQGIGDHLKAIEYLEECLEIRRGLKDKYYIAVALNNLGNCYFDLKKKTEARKYYLQAIELYESIGDKWGLADTYGNIAVVESESGNYPVTEKYFIKALDMKKSLGDNIGIAQAWRNIGAFYSKTKKFTKAFDALNTAVDLFSEAGALDELEETYLVMADVYHDSGNDRKAFEFQKKYSELRDTILSEARTRSITEMATKYETEKKEKEIKIQQQNIELKNKKIQLQNATIARDSYIKYSLFGIALFVVLLAGILFYAYYNKRKSNKIISAQKKEVEAQRDETAKQKIIVEEKNKEILDSIAYARRIQNIL